MSCPFEHLDACLPITAILVLGLASARIILKGCGPYVLAIDEASGALLHRVQVFERNTVHGIKLAHEPSEKVEQHSARCLVWGGQSLRLLDIGMEIKRISSGDLISFACPEYSAPDWILDAAFVGDQFGDVEYAPPRRACLITAHNVLLGLELEASETLTKIYLYEINKGPKSVLYSADVAWLSPSQILVAAGTVFGEIVVWSCRLPLESDLSTLSNSSVSLHHLFTGHEGSIFGVDISSEITFSEGVTRRLLASCSDDRTIRVWDISDCTSPSDGSDNSRLLGASAPRSTGFGGSTLDELDINEEACITKAWGHTSRIWGAYFLDASVSDGTASIRLLSRGEDATCQLWDLSATLGPGDGKDSPLWSNATLKNNTIYDFHSGKHIWSIAISKLHDSFIVYSGGADGRLMSFDIACNTASSASLRFRVESVEDIVHQSPSDSSTSDRLQRPVSGKKAKQRERINRFAFVSECCFVAISTEGRVVLTCISDPKTAEISEANSNSLCPVSGEVIATEESLKSYSVISSHPELGVAMVGDASCRLWCYRHADRSFTLLTQLERKITATFAVNSNADQHDPAKSRFSLSFLASYGGMTEADLFIINDVSSLADFTRIRFSLPTNFIITSNLLIESKSCLILGSRNGGLVVVNLENSTGSMEPHIALHVLRLHEKDAITSIVRLPRSENTESESILTTGRDGYFCVHVLTGLGAADQSPTLQTVHKTSPPFGPNIEGAYFDKMTNDMILFGFKGTDFIAWNESNQTTVTALNCGGAHRSWAYNSSQNPSGRVTFLWTQASAFHIYSRTTSSHKTVRAGSHGREIKTMDISDRGFHVDGKKQKLLATGGEDATVRVFTVDETVASTPSTSFKCLRILKKHASGLQHVKWSSCGRFLFTSSACEEFFVWRIRTIPGFGIGTVCESECPESAPKSDLRVTSFDVMEISGGSEDEVKFLICMAYSNSMVRLFVYSSGPSFGLLAKGQYTTNCLTHISFVQSESNLSLITGATDGHIALWDISDALPTTLCIKQDGLEQLPTFEVSIEPSTIGWHVRHSIQQSSIKEMEITRISETKLLIVGGGDDNAMSVSQLTLPNSQTQGIDCDHSFSKTSFPQAHASAITAISIFRQHPASTNGSQETTPQFNIVTSGNDQRLKLWSVEINSLGHDGDDIRVSLLDNAYTAIADVSSIGKFTLSEDPRGDEEKAGNVTLAARQSDRLVVCGVGMDLWALNREYL
ncbi:hypothetical protein AJ80_06173 [Polytolypa hystricis UAMH7299]|uniref:Uncharacterized protein n=1 Tax=Polytolypa hystricis (strain UAMH7299) TaxID=1447883 RepID=A0A2B7XQ60_POLH7|nr:hypothetical protein AJ80_06173 [Polytolypa hystricis UAMH7299]